MRLQSSFLYNFSLKLHHFRIANYYTVLHCDREPQDQWLAAQLMDIARMHVTDSLTLFVKTKSSHMPKEGWYNVKVPMEKKKKKSISWEEREKVGQVNGWKGPCPSPLRQSVRGQYICIVTYIYVYTCMRFEKEKKCWMQVVSCLEHKADKSNISECANAPAAAREHKQLPNAWQDCQGRFLSDVKQ